MLKIKLLQDDRFNWYTIPNNMENLFYNILDEIYNLEDNAHEKIEEFEQAFSKYKLGEDVNKTQLYIEIERNKKRG